MAGFSLVELSIVLVILGLLVGGILSGQALIRASELRAVSSEYQRYITALHTFRDKYFAIPGDMATAQNFWPASATCPGLAATAAAGVCNGNGDGMLTRTVATSHEPFGAWEHLVMAGLIEGNFTGNTTHAATAADNSTILGVNVPRSKLNNAGWTVYYFNTMPISDPSYFDGSYNTFLFFGASPGANVTFNPVLRSEEAWNIDTKLDDGRPATGLVKTREADGGTCTDLAASTVTSLTNSAYKLDTTSVACSLMMLTGF